MVRQLPFPSAPIPAPQTVFPRVIAALPQLMRPPERVRYSQAADNGGVAGESSARLSRGRAHEAAADQVRLHSRVPGCIVRLQEDHGDLSLCARGALRHVHLAPRLDRASGL